MASKPLYLQIKDELKEKIESRQLLPGQQLPTEFELARQHDVSRITSKKALEELEKEGYIRRRRGQGSFVAPSVPKTNNSKIISMILPHFRSESWSMAYIKGAMDFLNARGFFLSIHGSSELGERNFFSRLIQEGIGGIIFYPDCTNVNISQLTAMSMNHFPVVTIDKAVDGLPISSVTSDNFSGGYMATRHLIDYGHRHIAIVYSSQISERSSVRDRFVGYCQALTDAGIEIVPEYIVDGYFRAESQTNVEKSDHEVLRKILRKLIDANITGLLVENDYEGMTVYRILKEMGVRIPEDLSLVGFDNSELLMSSEVHMTTVNQHFHKIGRRAAEMIIEHMDEQVFSVKKIVLPVDLVPGQTSGAVSVVSSAKSVSPIPALQKAAKPV